MRTFLTQGIVVPLAAALVGLLVPTVWAAISQKRPYFSYEISRMTVANRGEELEIKLLGNLSVSGTRLSFANIEVHNTTDRRINQLDVATDLAGAIYRCDEMKCENTSRPVKENGLYGFGYLNPNAIATIHIISSDFISYYNADRFLSVIADGNNITGSRSTDGVVDPFGFAYLTVNYPYLSAILVFTCGFVLLNLVAFVVRFIR